MPIRAHDGRRLVDLRRDERQPLFPQSKDVDLDLERIVRAELCDNSTRENIEVVKAFEDASEGAGISVGDYSKSK
jgi:hypothetical protein